MKKGNVKGFTMTELMTVVAIMGILASLAIPNMMEYINSMRLYAAARMVYTDLIRAQSIARTNSSICLIKFDTVSRSYTINEKLFVNIPDGIRFGVAPGVTGKPGAPYEAPPVDGIAFDSPGHVNTAIFYSTGDVVPAGTVYLTDGSRTIAIRLATVGRPRIWRSTGGRKWSQS